jgi:membrane protein DedA with SNARE-associated domain
VAPGVATKVIAASCALTAFAVGVLSGLFAGNPAETILLRAIIALVVGNLLGFIIGTIGERTVAEAVTKYQNDHPIPGVKTGTSA